MSQRDFFLFFDIKLSKNSEFYYLGYCFYPSITDIAEAKNTLFQERHNHSENCITVEVSRRTQKVEINLANDESSLAVFSTDLEHICGSKAGNDFGMMFKRKGLHKPEIAYDILHMHSLMIQADLIEYNIVGDAKTPLLRCFYFI